MTAVQKFMFDQTFDGSSPTSAESKSDADSEQTTDLDSVFAQGEEEIKEEEIQPGFSEHQMETAKAEAFEAGRQAGVEDASKTVEQDTLNAVRAVGQHITELFGKQEQANNTMTKDGVGIASTIVRKLFPALDEAARLDEISRLVEQTLLRLIEEPRVVIRINPALMDTLGSRLDGLKAGAGYEGRIILKEDSALDLGDCRLEWGDGSAERNAAMLWQTIDTIIKDSAGIVEQIMPEDVMVDVTPTGLGTTDGEPDDALSGEPETSTEPVSEDAPESTPESMQEKPQETPDIAGTPEPSTSVEPQKTTDSQESDDQGMIAEGEVDIVEPDQTSELDKEVPSPDSRSDEEIENVDDQAGTKTAGSDEVAPDPAELDEMSSEETGPEEHLSAEKPEDDTQLDETISDETDT